MRIISWTLLVLCWILLWSSELKWKPSEAFACNQLRLKERKKKPKCQRRWLWCWHLALPFLFSIDPNYFQTWSFRSELNTGKSYRRPFCHILMLQPIYRRVEQETLGTLVWRKRCNLLGCSRRQIRVAYVQIQPEGDCLNIGMVRRRQTAGWSGVGVGISGRTQRVH